jgi:hypothetical protein
MHPACGQQLIEMSELDILVDYLGELMKADEELLLNVIGCLSNVSFYLEKHSRLVKLFYGALRDWMELFMSSNDEMVIETVRLFANMTRFYQPIPKPMMTQGIYL